MTTYPSGTPFQDMLKRLARHESLSANETAHLFQIMLNGGATPAQMAGLLTALHMKGETIDELTGAAQAMRAKMLRVEAPINAVDTCGTGGDGTHSLNVSTTVALVVAACGVPVAKHGNRSVSSRCGSADVLEALGVNLHLDAEGASRTLRECGIVFLMAPVFHPNLRHVGPVRRELGFRTMMNLLGPLCSPAGVKRQLLGVFSPELVRPMAEVLHRLGCDYALVVHGGDGSDELSLEYPSPAVEVTPDGLRELVLDAREANLPELSEEEIKGTLTGGDAQHNAQALMQFLSGKRSLYRNSTLLNAAAALIVAGKVETLSEGVTMAAHAIDSGAAKTVLAELVRLSHLYGARDHA
jgi:anthranilate phosphoribosyltransferase